MCFVCRFERLVDSGDSAVHSSRFNDMLKKKKYKISISEFVPADEWIEEMEKALHGAEP